MAYAGAAGQTATEMATALHLGAAAGQAVFEGQDALSQAVASRGQAAFAAEQKLFQAPGQPGPSASDYDLDVVNSVWGDRSVSWAPPFLKTLATSYGAGVHLQDFMHEPDPARLAINDWVSSQTHDKINDLLPPGSIDNSTLIVLVNAIHLKFPSDTPFDPSATMPGTFTRSDGTTVSPSFMNLQTSFLYVDDGQAQIASLPLSNGQVSVVIVRLLLGCEADLLPQVNLVRRPQIVALARHGTVDAQQVERGQRRPTPGSIGAIPLAT